MPNRNEISEEIKILYRMFLVHGAFVTEYSMKFDNPSRDDCLEELKIKSFDGEYTVEMRINRSVGKILMDVMRHEPRHETVLDWNGTRHFIV